MEPLSPVAPIWQDVLAQAVTGELLAAMNYTSLSEICDDPEEVSEALEHAQEEQHHAARFAAEGRRIGVDVTNNVEARHWKRLRAAFLRCVAERDFISCLIVQEIMLESTSGMPWKFSERSVPLTRRASTTKCTGCIWT
jgi:ferritin